MDVAGAQAKVWVLFICPYEEELNDLNSPTFTASSLPLRAIHHRLRHGQPAQSEQQRLKRRSLGRSQKSPLETDPVRRLSMLLTRITIRKICLKNLPSF